MMQFCIPQGVADDAIVLIRIVCILSLLMAQDMPTAIGAVEISFPRKGQSPFGAISFIGALQHSFTVLSG